MNIWELTSEEWIVDPSIFGEYWYVPLLIITLYIGFTMSQDRKGKL